MNTNRRRFLTLMAVTPTLLKQASVSNAATLDERNPIAVYGQSVVYGIYRNKKKIGEHTLQFTNTDNSLLVKIESKIVVTVLKVPVYRFNYRSTEAWLDGQLQRVDAATNDNGKKYQVSANRIDNDMLLTDKSGNTTKTSVAFTSNHWNSQVLTADKLFNTLTGKTNDIDLQNIGVEPVTISENPIEATHYRLAGNLKTDLWYDNTGRWVQLRFKGDDDSIIEYRCKGFNV